MPTTPVSIGVIPARGQSSRFPMKMLARICGKPLVQHVWELASQAKSLSQLIVATDSEEIASVVSGFGGVVRMTSADLKSGTDRVALVAEQSGADIVVNIQGDEPLLPPQAIDRLVDTLGDDDGLDMATLVVRRRSSAELENSNIVKVVVSRNGRALYFSRQPIASGPGGQFHKHVGIYAYRYRALMQFCRLELSPLEQIERLEQLRALENGLSIQTVELDSDTVAVDTPSDIELVTKRLEKD